MFKFSVNPMENFGNDFNLELEGTYPDFSDKERQTKDGFFWYQDEETGLTEFVVHNGILRPKEGSDDKEWVSDKRGGFGGAKFTYRVEDLGTVTLDGPWSGNYMNANKVLPKKVFGCSLGNIATNITIEKVCEMFEGTDFSLVVHTSYPSQSKGYYEILYKGQSKHHMSKAMLTEVVNVYKASQQGVEVYELLDPSAVECWKSCACEDFNLRGIIADWLEDRGFSKAAHEMRSTYWNVPAILESCCRK